MSLEELKNQVLTLVGGTWTQEESDEIDEMLSIIESGSESQIREKIDSLSYCLMLVSICERF